MDLDTKAYDQIGIIGVSGTVSVEDLARLTQGISEWMPHFQNILISFEGATFSAAPHDVVKIKHQLKTKSPKVILIVPQEKAESNGTGIDANSLAEGLDRIGSGSGDRILAYLKAVHQQKKLINEIQNSKIKTSNLLRRVSGLKEKDAALTEKEFQGLYDNLRKEALRLAEIYKGWQFELQRLQKMSKTDSPPTPTAEEGFTPQQRIDEVYKKVFTQIKP